MKGLFLPRAWDRAKAAVSACSLEKAQRGSTGGTVGMGHAVLGRVQTRVRDLCSGQVPQGPALCYSSAMRRAQCGEQGHAPPRPGAGSPCGAVQGTAAGTTLPGVVFHQLLHAAPQAPTLQTPTSAPGRGMGEIPPTCVRCFPEVQCHLEGLGHSQSHGLGLCMRKRRNVCVLLPCGPSSQDSPTAAGSEGRQAPRLPFSAEHTRGRPELGAVSVCPWRAAVPRRRP